MFCYIGKVSVPSPSHPNVSYTWLNWLKQTITIHPSHRATQHHSNSEKTFSCVRI